MQTPDPREGVELTVECTVTGNPAPEVSWFKDGSTLTSGGNIFVSTSNEGVAQVRISSASTTDSGVYLCIVENLAGSVNQSFRVDVTRKCSFDSFLRCRMIIFFFCTCAHTTHYLVHGSKHEL